MNQKLLFLSFLTLFGCVVHCCGQTHCFEPPKIFFEKNSTKMKSGADSALYFMKKTLIDNPGMVMELSGHCGYDEGKQVLLAQQRAVIVCDSLIAMGVAKNRVYPMGYGAKKLIIPKSDVDKCKTKEEKEAAMAHNRRCVIKVIRMDLPFVKTLKDSVFAVWDIIELPLILFDPNNGNFARGALDSLNRVYDFLIKQKSLVVELGVHTGSRASETYNQYTSDRRAKACVDYLVTTKGFPASRITSKGYGESQLIYTDDVIAREKEMEKQELLHRKNMRTELKVLRIE